jgi:hypothetical protein
MDETLHLGVLDDWGGVKSSKRYNNRVLALERNSVFDRTPRVKKLRFALVQHQVNLDQLNTKDAHVPEYQRPTHRSTSLSSQAECSLHAHQLKSFHLATSSRQDLPIRPTTPSTISSLLNSIGLGI